MELDPSEEYKQKLKLKKLPGLKPSKKSNFQLLNCPSCGHPTPAANININDKIAKCSACNAVFSFQEEIADIMSDKQAKEEVVRPEGIDVYQYRNELEITLNQPVLPWEVIVPVFTLLFTFIFTLVYFKKGTIPMMVPALFWLGSVFSVLPWINRSRHKVQINIDEDSLSVIWRPKKAQKDQHYRIEEIDQLYTSKKTGIHTLYMIINGEKGQKHVTLLANLDSLSKARYLEQEIESYLGIEDRRVPEETS
ncbi:MAG: hypothetical protein AAF990_01800 [Bacteroidota bacterium]